MSVQRGEERRKHPRPRLETLSDLIYGLSLSIGAISLVITNNQASTANDINRNVFEFLFVFLILIIIVLLSLAVPWNWLFLGVHVRLFIWYVPIVSFWLNRMRIRPFGIPCIPSRDNVS